MLSAAHWITSPISQDTAAVVFQKQFTIRGKVKQATLAVTAIGLYTATLGGHAVTDTVMNPGFTSYHKRVQVQVYPVDHLLTEGENSLHIEAAPGWACSELGWDEIKEDRRYFAAPAVRAVLTIRYEDGNEQRIATDESFAVYTSPIRSSTIYHGETVDLTHTPAHLGQAKEIAIATTPIPTVGVPVRLGEVFHPRALLVTPLGERVVDFGQNLTGFVRLRVRGKAGERIVLHHAEVLDQEGNFYEENMRSAKNENVYILSGGEDVLHPTYTFQGFRYVKLCEYPDMPVVLEDLEAVCVHSDLVRTGDFVCGNEKINQLYHNVVFGQLSNYLDIPTDCPQRDERLGWTGDAQVFCRTAAINYDVERFFRKWLGDMAADQGADGSINGVIPANVQCKISTAWADAATIIPMELYMAYGNKELLRENFPMMKKWVDYMHGTGPEEFLWLGGDHYGDWLAMDGDPDEYIGRTPADLIASAFFAHSTRLVCRAGHILGEEVGAYEALYTKVRAAFRARYMKDGMVCPVADGQTHQPADLTQTALVLVLHFDLCEEEERQGLTERLCQMIRDKGTMMTTGFVGTEYILHALSANGQTDLAYDLLFREESPSWLFSVNQGATTMWEHWNGIKEDGSFWSADMNSFNHYAYGAVYDWIFGVALGITPTAPGYAEVRIAPHPDRRMGFAKASLESRSGKIISSWYYKGEDVHYEITLPQGVRATVVLESGTTATLSGGTHHFIHQAK